MAVGEPSDSATCLPHRTTRNSRTASPATEYPSTADHGHNATFKREIPWTARGIMTLAITAAKQAGIEFEVLDYDANDTACAPGTGGGRTGSGFGPLGEDRSAERT